MQNVLVTGGTGYLGRALVERLALANNLNPDAPPYRVFVTGHESSHPSGSEFLVGNFQELSANDLRRFAVVWHLAACTNPDASDDLLWTVNADAAIRFLARCEQAAVAKIVFVSSTSVYGNQPVPFYEESDPEPVNADGATKRAVESSLRGRHVCLRLSSVYGPGEGRKLWGRSVAYELGRAVRDRRGVEAMRATRDLLHVDDASFALEQAARLTPGIYNVATGIATTYTSVAESVGRLLGIAPNYIPAERRPISFQHSERASPARFRKALASLHEFWRPLSFEQGVASAYAAKWLDEEPAFALAPASHEAESAKRIETLAELHASKVSELLATSQKPDGR